MADFIMRLFIVLLLLAPFRVPLPRHAPEPLWKALRELAIAAEIWSPTGNWDRHNFVGEVGWTTNALRECRDCPSLSESLYLPSPGCAEAASDYLQKTADNLQAVGLVKVSHREEITGLVSEARRGADYWKSVLTATNESLNWPARRLALGHIRKLQLQSDADQR